MSWIFVKQNAVPWTPSDLTSLRAWYDADDSATIFDATTGGSLPSSGNDVARWEDKSGGGYHVTQATAASRPHYVTNTLNGKPVIECTAQWLTASTASDWNFLHQAGGASLFAVIKAGTTANPSVVYGILGNASNSIPHHGVMLRYDDASGTNDRAFVAVHNGVIDRPVVVSVNNAVAANTARLFSVLLDQDNATAISRCDLRIDGGANVGNNALTDAPSAISATSPIDLGSTGDGVLPLTGYIAEVVICDAKLADADREKVEGYLAHKWGLTANLAASHPYKTVVPTL